MTKIDDNLSQQLLELCYDLLPDAEAESLRARIEHEPHVAAAYARAQREVALLAEAARVHEPPIRLAVPEVASAIHSSNNISPASLALASNSAGEIRALRRASSTPVHWTNRWLAVAAALLVMGTIGGFARVQSRHDSIAANYVRMVVTAPTAVEPGISAPLSVLTTTITGEPMPAIIRLKAVSADGKLLYHRNGATDADGRLSWTLPADSMTRIARVEVLAEHEGVQESTIWDPLFTPPRLVAQLSLDKPLYQPGQAVYFSALALERYRLAAAQSISVAFEVTDPSGAVVESSRQQATSDHGVASGLFALDEGVAGGQYTLVARSPQGLFPEEKQKFWVREYRVPRLKQELEFARDSYGPGDEVVANFSAVRAEGGAPAGAPMTVRALVDGASVYETTVPTSEEGTARIAFKLPAQIERGEGQLVVTVDDGGSRETLAKTVPINLGKLQVEFFPEGGDLVAGLPNRVYFRGRNTVGEPVHLEGEVLDDQQAKVADVKTTHEGLGAFAFTPKSERTYRLKITKPSGTTSQPALPGPTKKALVLSIPGGVFAPAVPIELELHSKTPNIPVLVTASCRGVQVGQVSPLLNAGSNKIKLPLTEEAAGVVRVTVLDCQTKTPAPIAERLVYRKPARALRVSLAGHHEEYSPGEPVDFDVHVTDETGEPVAAAVRLSAVDDSVLKLADKHLPLATTHFMLGTEIEKAEDLEDANFYLGNDALASESLDLLLGTQGWRRFLERQLPTAVAVAGENPLKRQAALGGTQPPSTVIDNMSKLQSAYQGALAASRARDAAAWASVSRAALLGAICLGLVLLGLAAAQLLTAPRYWGSAALATAALAVMALTSWNSPPTMQHSKMAVAYAGFQIHRSGERNDTTIPRERGIGGGNMQGVNQLGMQWNYQPIDGLIFDRLPANAQNLDLYFAMPHGNQVQFGLQNGMGGVVAEAEGYQWRGWGAGGFGGQQMLGGFGGAGGGRDMLELAKHRGRQRMFWQAGAQNGGIVAGAAAGGKFADLANLATVQPAVVREYAHVHQAGSGGVRTDFAETVFWHPLLLAGPDGKAHAHFELTDSVTTYRVLAEAHADAASGLGRLGSNQAELRARLPFNLDLSLPIEVTAGDRLSVPLGAVNRTGAALPVTLSLNADALLTHEDASEQQVTINPQGRTRRHFHLLVTGNAGQANVEARGMAANLADAERRSIRVVPTGFPVAQSYSGRLEGTQEVNVKLPASWVPGSLEVSLNAFPSSLAEMQKGVAGMLREPSGCFEQASSSNYPNIMSLQYLEEHHTADPALMKSAREMLGRGYATLQGYECKQKGYEWFGSDPGHEALTAYGLMEFHDMARVFPVNETMLERTRSWLLSRRDGKGGFERSAQALDTFGGAPPAITNAYIVWALSEAGERDITKELQATLTEANKSDDPYLLALAAGSAVNVDDPSAGALLDKLASAQAADGHLTGKAGSITRSGGLSLEVETTALAALAWLKRAGDEGRAKKAIDWIIRQRQDGGFGSTQATILALKALVAHSKQQRRTITAGELLVKREGVVLTSQSFGPGRESAISSPGLEAKLVAGDNRLTISLTGDNAMPYTLDVSYRAAQPATDDRCPLRLTTKLERSTMKQSETVGVRVGLINTSSAGQPMSVAIVGLPAGLQARADQLDELKKAGTIDYYETRGREVVCYWRSLAPNKHVDFRIDCVAQWPGKYTAPASRTYLYYTAEQKQWIEPLKVEIAE